MIGLSPRQVDDCSLWEMAAITQAWALANGGGQTQVTMTDAEDERLRAKYADHV